jgi:CRP/FNR family cyclic AMP-dependent transcriptional regulator
MAELGLLRATDLFEGVPDPCLETLEKNSDVFDCDVGHLFFSRGESGRGLFVLEKGRVRTFRSYGNKKLTVAMLEAPTVFGEMGCFGQAIYHCSAEAIKASRVRIISREIMMGILKCDSNLANRIIDLMSRRFVRCLHELESFAIKGLMPRLASLLLEKAKEDAVIGMTHKDLASQLGVYRESVTSALGELRRAGIIHIERKEIRILQLARLERATRE